MKRIVACAFCLAITVIAIPACSKSDKKDENTGPRITGGAPTDPNARPAPRGVGGSGGNKPSAATIK